MPFNEWIFPKGGLETGETIKECATRETQEETSLQKFELISKLPVSTFTYYADDQQTKFNKTVHYFLAKYHTGKISLKKNPDPGDLQEHTKISWFPLSEAINRVKYPQEKLLLQKVKILLDN